MGQASIRLFGWFGLVWSLKKSQMETHSRRNEPMSSKPSQAPVPRSVDETEVRALYRQLLSGWNRRSAGAIAELFVENGVAIGFDGSELEGQKEIALQTFDDDSAGAFVAKVRDVQFLNPEVAILRAVAGMVLPGQSDLAPDKNLFQTLVAAKSDDHWRVAVFQNTPARFRGRPEEARSVTEDLRRQL
jgi:uncharacterized protein (TIGR02246 family)